jgi:hypothetical protein
VAIKDANTKAVNASLKVAKPPLVFLYARTPKINTTKEITKTSDCAQELIINNSSMI